MARDRCPKEDPLQSLGPDSVFEVACPKCGAELEFLGEEKHRKCGHCGEFVPNPKLTPDEAK